LTNKIFNHEEIIDLFKYLETFLKRVNIKCDSIVKLNNSLNLTPNLTHLTIEISSIDCDDLIDTIATKLKNLEYLNTSKCFYLKDSHLIKLASLTKLNSLILYFNKTITDFGLNEIIKSLNKIVLIDIKSIGGSESQITQKYYYKVFIFLFCI
jgi:hypothetical protein